MEHKPFVDKLSHGPEITGTGFEPWLTRDAITILNKMIKPFFIGMEWGCGSSTAWFCDRMRKLYTVEHVPEWAQKVYDYMHSERIELLQKWELIVIPIDSNRALEPEYIDGGGDSRKRYALAETVPNELDFICVDGRARRGCLITAIKKLKPSGGILVLDNSNRPYNIPAIVPNKWKKIITNNTVWETTIWISK